MIFEMVTGKKLKDEIAGPAGTTVISRKPFGTQK